MHSFYSFSVTVTLLVCASFPQSCLLVEELYRTILTFLAIAELPFDRIDQMPTLME
jgi:hypothetical protein